MSLLTKQEHEQGWKQVDVTLRSGGKTSVTLSAPSRADYRQLQLRMAKDKAVDEVYELCVISLGEQKPLLDQVTPMDAQIIEATVLELTYGAEFIDRLVKHGQKAAEQPASEGSPVPNVPVPALTA